MRVIIVLCIGYRDHTSKYHYNAVPREPFRVLTDLLYILVGDSAAPGRSVSKPTAAY